MRVFISGGGIAGLTLAYWLYHFDMAPLVIERADHIGHDGYGIDFFGTGYDMDELLVTRKVRYTEVKKECREAWSARSRYFFVFLQG